VVKLFRVAKDGGPESNVTGYWLIEWKRWFSIALLRFEDGSRDAFHSHAFNSISWLLSGCLKEYEIDHRGDEQCWRFYIPDIVPIITRRETFHKVRSYGRSWVLTFRGPWRDEWREYRPVEDRHVTLTHGRKEL
jgi:hypothetical protein